MLDILILLTYAVVAWAWPKPHHKTSSVCLKGAIVCFLAAWGMLLLPTFPPYFFHLILCIVCFWWSKSMIKDCSAKYSAIAIFLFGILQMRYSIDWYVFAATPTWLSDNFVSLAMWSHILIIMAASIDGIIVHNRASCHGTVGSGAN